MKKKLIGLVAFLGGSLAFAQTQYKVEIDLTAVADDQLPVTIYTPAIDTSVIEYHMAKIVPGTYSISDFGRFITNFTATNTAGDTLDVEKISTNRWKISNADQLHKITYKAHDTWDKFGAYGEEDQNIIFEPGGTNINAEDQIFMLNTFGLIGYLKGFQFSPYEVKVKHDETTFGATALKKEMISNVEDLYTTEDFNFLADGPIMYSVPDTITKQIANAKVLVSLYSPNNMLTSKEIMDNINDLMKAQAEFLGGELPVDRYAYLVYLHDGRPISGSMGALEHSYSSLYSMPEAGADRIAQSIRDISAHEFFHIVTPLNIHSEEIGEFNYIEPQMSKHLWLYEGVTEYNSMLVQVKYNLYGLEKFMDEIKDKLRVADRFPNVSFTEMSERILEEDYEKMYSNVYYKGALIGMCLDLYLTKYSDGEKDLQWLFQELSKKYGKNKSFKDDELFDVIEALTYPEVREFLDTYVAGDTPLPIAEVLEWAGIEYIPYLNVKEISLGGLGIKINEDREIVIDNLDNANEFAKVMGYRVEDIISEINGETFTLGNARQIMDDFKTNTKAGDKVIIKVKRVNKRGKLKEKKLKGKALEIEKKEKHYLELMPEPTEDQYKILRAWIVAGL